ncbi:uncharacterized protein LOC123550166 [Mercenaria mercenaria]|uniref:uncharacterized protein LOC123550166 n=1 Tax=Mercenaria mercenaria TaxID=6596 RepID=UPI00234E53F0|nr:uncharacterized protein LOC123550166 [Mercenaria mercenaria]
MVKFILLLMVSLVVGGHSDSESSSNSGSDSSSRCEKSKKCPFKVKSDLVTLEDFKQKVVGEVWIGIFSSKFSANQSFGRKCNFGWNATDSDSGMAELFCYSLRTNKCENFSLTTIKTEDECGRIQENDVYSAAVAKLYSQDTDQYLWHDVCYRFNTDGECIFRYLDLLVKKWRGLGELDLNGLPLHLIAIDMKTNFNLDFSGEIGQFSWKEGPECGLDGS